MKGHRLAMGLALALPALAAQLSGDAERGRQLFETRCIGCHSIDSNRIGPALRGVLGRRSGGVADFDYSNAVRNAQLVWDPQNLDRWLSGPEAFLPGQRMGYMVASADDRADLIAYLTTLDDSATPSARR